ncbi:MAG: hypothetical protein ABIQ18_19705 [Umezawaea sp.]
MVAKGSRAPNTQLADARRRLSSPTRSDRAVTRQQLADALNSYLRRSGAAPEEHLDYRDIGHYELGHVRWPSDARRAAFRHVLGAATDAELGFRQRGASAVEPRLTPPSAPSLLPSHSAAADQSHPGVVAIRSMSQAFQAADRRVGGGVLYQQVHRFLQTEVAPLLLAPDSGPGGAVFAAAASMTECAGWMAHDGGHDHLAQHHFDRAFRLAGAADDAAVSAAVCASMSHLAGQLGHGADAVRLADVGLERARRAPGTAPLVARLHAMRARGQAILGDRVACLSALEQADRVLAELPDEPAAPWVPGFDEGSLAAEAALCLRRIGDLRAAEHRAHRALDLRSGDRIRARAFAQLILAYVLKDAGRVDEAAAWGRAVVAVASSLTSSRVQVRLDRLGRELGTHRDTPQVTTFLDELSTMRSGYGQNDRDTASWPV